METEPVKYSVFDLSIQITLYDVVYNSCLTFLFSLFSPHVEAKIKSSNCSRANGVIEFPVSDNLNKACITDYVYDLYVIPCMAMFLVYN